MVRCEIGPVQTLARLAIQSERYRDDADFRHAVDNVLNVPVYDAAPELLELLKALHSCHRAFSSNDNWTVLDDEAREAAENVIDKAEGR